MENIKKDILITLKRIELQEKRTFGKLIVNNEQIAFTIEDKVRDIKIQGKTAIPYGTYELSLRTSPRFSDSYYYSSDFKKLITKEEFVKLRFKLDYQPHKMMWLKNVKNDVMEFDFVLIHWGNTELDTEGCIIVGSEMNTNSVLKSRLKYVGIYSNLVEQIKLGNKYIEIVK